jgi:glycosyltransferase involved in cell wall biosynthesis
MEHSVVVELLERIERFMYYRARRVVCLTYAFRENLAARGVPLRKLSVVRNGVELDLFQPTSLDMNLSAQINPEGKFLVGYYGTMGAAHGLESAVEAAALLDSVRFLFVGDGAEVDKLKQKVSGLNLDNVVFLPPQPRSDMPKLIAACDLALVQLRSSDILGTAVPSKVFEAMAMSRPVVLAAPYGEAADIVLDAECGVHVAPGDPAALAASIQQLLDSEEDRQRLGSNGYRAARSFSREAQARQFLEILEDVRADRDEAQ